MLEELLKKEITYNDINEYINFLLASKNLESYVDKELLSDLNTTKYLSAYAYAEKTLKINIDKISEYFKVWFYQNNIDEKDRNRYYGIFISYIINREIRHIEQIEESKSTSNPVLLEGIEMYKRFPYDLTSHEKMIYENYFDYIPLERNATITAFLQVLEYGSKYDNTLLNEDEILFIRSQLDKYCKSCYTESSCPTEKYYKLVRKKKDYKKIELNGMDECHRILWGLPRK